MPTFTFADLRELTALGVVCLIFILIGFATYKIILPKFFSYLETMTLREVTLEMRTAMHEAVKTSQQIAKDSQEFTLKVLDQVGRDQKEQKKEKQNVS
jgi:hypothetical protein